MNKQTLYEKIKIIVESWNIAITQREDWHFTLRSSLMDSWEIRRSISDLDIDKCVNYLWGTSQKEYHFLEKKWERYIWIYERPLWRPKVGQKVQMLNNIKFISSHLQHLLGVPLDVEDLASGWCIIKKENAWRFVPYDCIAPRVSIDE